MINFKALRMHSKLGNIKHKDFRALFQKIKCAKNKKDYKWLYKNFFEVYQISPQWKMIREKVISRQDGECYDCNSKVVDIHHLTYERLGDEKLDDLIGLCRFHHKYRHGLSRPNMLHEFLRI